jgi:hypothetical protein
MRRLLLGLGWLACVTPAPAATLVQTDVAHDHSRYTITFEVLLDADHATVARLLGDYARLNRLSPTVIDSRILGQSRAGQPRVHVIVRACALFLCKTVNKVTDIARSPDGELRMRNVPALSDFTEGEEVWQLQPEGRATRVRYQANMVPKFFVPPVIGPLVIKAVIRRELRESAQRMEALAQGL